MNLRGAVEGWAVLEKGGEQKQKSRRFMGGSGAFWGPDSAAIAKPIILNNPHVETSEQSNIIMTACCLKWLVYR